MAVNNLVNIKIKAVENLSDKLKGIEKSTKWVEKSVNSMRSKFENLQPTFKRMAWFGVAAFWALTFWANKAINSATDLEETTNKMNVVFKDLWNQAQDTANKLADGYWLSSQEARGFIADLGDMTTWFGLGQNEALKYAEEVSKLWVDLASFTNLSGWSAEAVDRLNKGFLWEHENLKALGIIINQSLLDQQLLADGTAHLTWLELERAKIQARMNIAMSQTVNAQWDYARSNGTLAQQQRELAAQTANLEVAMWNLIAPIKLAVVSTFTPFIEKITTLIEKNPELAKNIWITAVAVTGLVTIIWTLGLLIPAIVTWFWWIAVASKTLWIALRFLALNPIWLVITAIASGIAIWVTIVKNWDTIKQKSFELWAKLMELYEKYKILFAMFLPIISMWIELYKNWDVITEKARQLWSNMQSIWTWIKDSIIWIVQSIVDSVTEKFDALVSSVTALFDKVKWLYEWAKNLAGKAIKAAKSAWSAVWGAVSNAVWARATWWPVIAGSTYRVNEQGQEFFTPKQSGTITPAGQMGSININMWWVVVQKEADENRLIEKMKAMITQEAKNFNLWIV